MAYILPTEMLAAFPVACTRVRGSLYEPRARRYWAPPSPPELALVGQGTPPAAQKDLPWLPSCPQPEQEGQRPWELTVLHSATGLM